ncbi:TetR/AcrR family transcriptional regulator [Actinokineospora sp. NBRC 105648]|uniref:TetR/AcrR family transcriptional regulator n=1 Tax=Actinokineospora sp. NBRC 105648 TaxID=3032206 RepID=UPI0024A56376|nr:TetR/AcrR family transcriptional regulator [Actinokineospora sp. NBRC 105648]GLZ37374.1 TetR family transcriptional regulator [Actinokineospora sp. NBRC 105648]
MTDQVLADLWPDVRPDAARRLMAAAVEAFAERGFHATTTRDIATAAGMSPAALYVHFPSKAAVLFAISRSGHERALAMVTEAAAGPGDPAARMAVLVAGFVTWHATRHRVARIVQYELGALDPADYAAVVAVRRRTEGVVRGLIEEGVAAGVFRVADVRTAARAVLSLGIDVARWYSGGSRPGAAELGRQYAVLVAGMLGAR